MYSLHTQGHMDLYWWKDLRSNSPVWLRMLILICIFSVWVLHVVWKVSTFSYRSHFGSSRFAVVELKLNYLLVISFARLWAADSISVHLDINCKLKYFQLFNFISSPLKCNSECTNFSLNCSLCLCCKVMKINHSFYAIW